MTNFPSEDGYDHARAALVNRRQRARKAYYDTYAAGSPLGGERRKDAIREAIETATRVRVDDDVCEAAQQAFPIFASVDEARPVLIAAFRAAGFEVEQ